MPQDATLHVKLDNETDGKLKKLAYDRGKSKGQLVREAISACYQTAMDDRAARQCCGDRGIPLTGTIGILMACCNGGTLSPEDADDILDPMIANGFYSPVRRISDLI